MFAIAFDLVVAETRKRHPVGASQAYAWLPPSVRDIRAFRVEQGSDFTDLVRR